MRKSRISTNRIEIRNRSTLESSLKIGFVQTTVDEEFAWSEPMPTIQMKSIVQRKVWQEIRKGFYELKDYLNRPQIIILPELTVPRGNINDLMALSKDIGSVVIAGLDFEEIGGNRVRNRAIITVPQNWPEEMKSRNISTFYFGKTFPSDKESQLFNRVGYKFFPDSTTYILDAGMFGKIGVAICSDFYDIERFVIYKGQIHHMIVVSHNRDTHSFYLLAEAISRLVYCNVVICNTGNYGDSLAFAPYRHHYKRIIYRHEGQKLFSTQVVTLPVLALDKAQRRDDPDKEFKSLPPGYRKARIRRIVTYNLVQEP
jgi:hypothetical protein